MITDLDTVPWDDIKPNSLIVTRLTGERLDKFVYTLRDKTGGDIKVVPMEVDTNVLVIEEEQLNQMGWYKQTSRCWCTPEERAVLDALP